MPLVGTQGSLSSKGFGEFKSGSSVFLLTSSGSVQNYNLASQATAAGWNGSSQIIFTNNGTIGSSSTGTAGLIISGSFPGGVTIYNTSYIVGAGGNTNSAGGTAIQITSFTSPSNILFYNTGIVGGGGGGGVSGYATAGGGAGYIAGSGYNSGSLTTGGYGAGAPCVGGGYGGGIGSAGGPGGGGGGGGLGAPGGQGASCYGDPDPYDPGGIRFGGYVGSQPAAGAATVGGANITWMQTGSRYGALN